jgi:hypothetical protein
MMHGRDDGGLTQIKAAGRGQRLRCACAAARNNKAQRVRLG